MLSLTLPFSCRATACVPNDVDPIIYVTLLASIVKDRIGLQTRQGHDILKKGGGSEGMGRYHANVHRNPLLFPGIS